jgi:RNA polymerase sigma-70 factor (ECF subfamily)
MSSTPSLPDSDRFQAADGQTSPPSPAGEVWPVTDHPILKALRSGSSADQETAFRKLFSTYTQPLRRYIRHHWPRLSETDIDDLVAEFLTLCLTGEKAHFLTFDPDRPGPQARLRTYLRTILENFLRNHRRHSNAKIRGGDRQFESLDTIRPAGHHDTTANGPVSATGVDIETYDRHWAQHIISVSFLALENGTPATREWLPVLRPWILADPGDTSLKQIARERSCTHDSVRTHLHRIRKTWRQAVREAVSHTVARPEDIDDELRHLAAVLSRHPME